MSICSTLNINFIPSFKCCLFTSGFHIKSKRGHTMILTYFRFLVYSLTSECIFSKLFSIQGADEGDLFDKQEKSFLCW